MSNIKFYKPYKNPEGNWVIHFSASETNRKIRKFCETFIRTMRQQETEVWPISLCTDKDKTTIIFSTKRKKWRKKWRKITLFRCIGVEENEAEVHQRLMQQINKWIGSNFTITLLSPQRKVIGDDKILLIFVATKMK